MRKNSAPKGLHPEIKAVKGNSVQILIQIQRPQMDNTCDWEKALTKIYGSCTKSFGKWDKFGSNKVTWSFDKVTKIGSDSVTYSFGKVDKIGSRKVTRSFDKVTQIGDTKI